MFSYFHYMPKAKGYKTDHFFLQIFSHESVRTHLKRQHSLSKRGWVSSYLLESLAWTAVPSGLRWSLMRESLPLAVSPAPLQDRHKEVNEGWREGHQCIEVATWEVSAEN